MQFKLFIATFISLISYQLSGQKDCQDFYNKFEEAYVNHIKPLEKDRKENADSIYQIYLPTFNFLDCPSFKIIDRFVRAYAYLTFEKFHDEKRTLDFLNETMVKYGTRNDSIAVLLYNDIGLIALRKGDFVTMRKNLSSAMDIVRTKLDPAFNQSIRTRANMALYHDWLSQEELAIPYVSDILDLYRNGIRKDIRFSYNQYSTLQGYYMELNDVEKSNSYLDTLLQIIQKEPEDVQKKYMADYHKIYMEFLIRNDKRDEAIHLYKTKLQDHPLSNDYDESFLFIPVILWAGEHQKAKMLLDSMEKLFIGRKMQPNHFYRIKKNAQDIMYYHAVNDLDKAKELLETQVLSYNKNLSNIFYLPEHEHKSTLKMLHTIASRSHEYFNTYDDEETIHNLYDFQSNFKGLSSRYIQSKNEIIAKTQDEELLKLFERQKELGSQLSLAKFSKSFDKLVALEDSIQKVNEQVHYRYILNKIPEDFISHRDILSNIKKDQQYIEFFETITSSKSTLYAYFMRYNEKVKLVKLGEYQKIIDNTYDKNANYVNNKTANIALYQAIIAPIMPYINPSYKTFCILDGITHNIALEILSPSGSLSNAPLISTDITYCINGKSAIDIMQKTYIKAEQISLIATGDIDYKCDQQPYAQNEVVMRGDKIFEPLPSSAKELDFLQKTATENQSKYSSLSACKATAPAFSTKVQNNEYNHIHISTHGFVEETKKQTQYFSSKTSNGLVFAPSSESQFLTALEISNLNLQRIDLCFLSACNTGLGEYVLGQGNYSIGYAFKLAGAKQVISTLWEIPDNVAAEFTEIFYTEYFKNFNAQQALIMAKNILKKKYPPKSWAAFRIVN